MALTVLIILPQKRNLQSHGKSLEVFAVRLDT